MTVQIFESDDVARKCDEYWSIHKRRWPAPGFTDGTGQTAFEWFYEDQRRENPWCNGRYALASIVWGLIIMLVWSLSI
jgi:hypothetical protein